MSYGSSCLIVVSVGRKEQLLGGERRARSLCHLSAPRQLGSSRSARCSISLCREISWEEVQGELDQWGNQLGESRRGTGSGQSQGTAASASSGPTAAACRAQPLDVLLLPAPTSRATQDREGSYPQVHPHTGSFWPWLWVDSSTCQLFQVLISSTAGQQSLPDFVARVFSAWCLPQAHPMFQGQVDI